MFCIRPIVAALTVAPEVVGVEDDERVAAAELEHRLLQVLAGERADGAARALAAGQGDALERGSAMTCSTSGMRRNTLVKTPSGAPASRKHCSIASAHLRGDLGVLEEDGVAEHQVRAGDPDDLVEAGSSTARWPAGRRPARSRRPPRPCPSAARSDVGSRKRGPFVGVVVEDHRAQLHLAGRLLACACPSRVVTRAASSSWRSSHELGGPADDGGALLDRAAAPLLVGGVGALDDAVDLAGRE